MESKTSHIRLILVLLLFCNGNLLGQSLDSLIYSDLSEFERKQVGIAQLESENELIHVMFDNFDYSVSFSAYDRISLKEVRKFAWKKNAENYANLEIHVVEYFQKRIIILFSHKDINTKEEVNSVSIIFPDGSFDKEIELSRNSPEKRFLPVSHYMFKSKAGGFLGVSSSKEGYRGDETEVKLHIIDSDRELIASNNISLPGSEKIAPPSQFEISNHGVIYFLSGLDKKKADIDGKLGLEKKVYQLYSYSYKLDKLKQFDVSIADKFISDVRMKLHKNGDLYVLGFYNNSHTKGAEGVFLMVIDGVSPKVKTSGKKILSTEIKKDFISDKRLEKNPVIDDLYLDHFFIKDDGNIVFIGEVFFVDKRLVNQNLQANLTTSVYYNFNDILCVELDSRLNYVQHQTVHKRQRSVNNFDIYYSYSVMDLETEKPYLVYNYSKNKNNKNVAEISGNSRTNLLFQPLFSEDSKRIVSPEKVKVAPGINAEFKNGFLVLQNRRKYMVSQMVF